MAFKAVMDKMEQEILQQILNKLTAMEANQKATNDRLTAMEANQKATNDRLTKIEEDIAELKESSQITRHSVNLLLNWAKNPTGFRISVFMRKQNNLATIWHGWHKTGRAFCIKKTGSEKR